MAEFLQQLQALAQFLKDLASKGLSVELVEQRQVEKLIGLAAESHLEYDHLSQALTVLESAPFSTACKSRLEAAAVEACSGAAPGAAGTTSKRKKQQDFASLGFYFTKTQWAALQSRGGEKFYGVADHAVALGLTNPTEATFQMMTAITMLLNQTCAEAMATPLHTKQQLLVHYKKIFKSRVVQVHAGRIDKLPEDPADLQRLRAAVYEVVFKDEPPVPHPFGQHLCQLAATIKMRRTGAEPALPAVVGVDQSWLMQMMGAFLQRKSGPPELQLDFPGRSGSPATRSMSTLALAAPPEPATLKSPGGSNSSLGPPAAPPPVSAPIAGKSVQEAGQSVLQAMAKAKGKAKAAKQPEEEEEEEEQVDAQLPMRKKPVMKRPACAAKAASYNHEHTRSQFVCRSGKKGPGSTATFKYGPNHGSQSSAEKKAQQWVRDHS